MREIRLALLEADVNFKVVKAFVARTKERCLTAEVLDSLTPAQNVVKVVLDELTELLGRTDSKLVLGSRIPNVIMLVGLQGSGKTTAAAKLAYRLKQENTPRCWWPVTCTAPPPPTSCRPWATRWACGCTAATGRTRCASPARACRTPSTACATW